MTVADVLTIGILVVNLLLIFLIYIQVRHISRPIITTKIIPYGTSVGIKPDVLVSGASYLVISNVSNNKATNLRIACEFCLGERTIARVTRRLSHLNPWEATKEQLGLDSVIKNQPELFKTVERGNETKTIPKKTLALQLRVTATCGCPPHKIIDSYKIEWDSLESVPDFEKHPIILCWNVRDALYIYKLAEGE